MKRLKTISAVLSVLVFISPVLGTLLMVFIYNADTYYQSTGLWSIQWILMGIYNIPFFATSTITGMLGDSFLIKQKEKASCVSFSISITSSIIGTLIMLAWGLGQL